MVEQVTRAALGGQYKTTTITGCTSEPPTTEPSTPELTDLQENICTQNSDCWSTNGGCFTREWFAIEDAKAREQGREDQRPIIQNYFLESKDFYIINIIIFFI